MPMNKKHKFSTTLEPGDFVKYIGDGLGWYQKPFAIDCNVWDIAIFDIDSITKVFNQSLSPTSVKPNSLIQFLEDLNHCGFQTKPYDKLSFFETFIEGPRIELTYAKFLCTTVENEPMVLYKKIKRKRFKKYFFFGEECCIYYLEKNEYSVP
jgi:hypothetical protein